MNEDQPKPDNAAIAASVIGSNIVMQANLATWGGAFDDWAEALVTQSDDAVAAFVTMADSTEALLRQAAIFSAANRRFAAALRAEAQRRGIAMPPGV